MPGFILFSCKKNLKKNLSLYNENCGLNPLVDRVDN